mmetsp:Transcript_62902/g.183961  ORF Transcript_62902/g.183961 Transcript_62902/m.183961 type:complete len:228 (-) Transcript_62902:236-919(-)
MQDSSGRKTLHHMAEPKAPTKTSVRLVSATCSCSVNSSSSTVARRTASGEYHELASAAASAKFATRRAFFTAPFPRCTSRTRRHRDELEGEGAVEAVASRSKQGSSAPSGALVGPRPQTLRNSGLIGICHFGKLCASRTSKSRSSSRCDLPHKPALWHQRSAVLATWRPCLAAASRNRKRASSSNSASGRRTAAAPDRSGSHGTSRAAGQGDDRGKTRSTVVLSNCR